VALRILAVSRLLPYPDEAAGDLRFFTMLAQISKAHSVTLVAINDKRDGNLRTAKAITRLRDLGVEVHLCPILEVLLGRSFEIAILEFFDLAAVVYDSLRTWQPEARIVVDSVDVHFHRLQSQARLSGLNEDKIAAEKVKEEEVRTYRRADLVITVSDADRRILKSEGLRVPIDVLPTLHAMLPPRPRPGGDRLELLFVGGYRHPPNVDAVVYLCNEILPLIKAHIPNVRLRLIGSNLTDDVRQLASSDVEVLGYVEDTSDYLFSSHISVAPIRYGAGINGKIGEAMAHGVPVVTTSVGAQGFGLVSGHHLLVGDNAADFAQAVVRLWSNAGLYEEVRHRGWGFIEANFSVVAVGRRLPKLITNILNQRVVRMNPVLRWARIMKFHCKFTLRGRKPH